MGYQCDMHSVIPDPAFWKINGLHQCGDLGGGGSSHCKSFSAWVDYCLAERAPAMCTVRISTYILMAVICCNLLKLLSLTVAWFVRDFISLVTLGDNIASFLISPEGRTNNIGPLSIADVKRGSRIAARRKKGKPVPLSQFKCQCHQWGRAVSMTRWCLCMFL